VQQPESHLIVEHLKSYGQESEVTLAPWLRELKQRFHSHAEQLLTSHLQKRDRAVRLSANRTVDFPSVEEHPDIPLVPTI